MSSTARRSDSTPPLLAYMAGAAQERDPSSPVLVQDPDTQLRNALKDAFKSCPKSRDEVADLLSRAVGREVGKATIDAWLSPSKEAHRVPAAYLPALCRILNTLGPLELLAELAGVRIADNRTLLLAERAKLDLQIAQARKSAKRIEQALEENP